MLGARVVTPIHYGVLDAAPVSVDTDNPVGRLHAAGEALGLQIEVREPGDWFDLG